MLLTSRVESGSKGGAEEGLSFAFRFTDTILQTRGTRCALRFMLLCELPSEKLGILEHEELLSSLSVITARSLIELTDQPSRTTLP
jgi:hypothetical protein